MPTTFSPNKLYQLQATGEDVNTWGINLNANFSLIDNNLGGTLSLNVGGNSNITLSTSQAQYLIHDLTGGLTGNINYIFPANGGFYAITNQTTGAYTLTVTVTGGSGGIVVPQGTTVTVYIDISGPTVEAFSGTQYVFTATSVGGTANAISVSSTLPSNYSLNIGTLLTLTPPNLNTGPATFTDPLGNTKSIKKVAAIGLAALVAGDIGQFPLIMQYDGTEWVGMNILLEGFESTVSTNQSVGFGNLFTPYVNTAPITYTIDQTTNLLGYWYVYINALGGAATIAINASDRLNGGSSGVGLVMPKGTSGRLTTDANGNLYLDGTAVLATPTAGDNSTKPATTAFVNGTALTLANGTTAITQSAGDNSTKPATTAYADAAVAASNPLKIMLQYNPSSTTIVANVGVSSVTKNSTGNYSINFSNSFPDNKYVALLTISGPTTQSNSVQIIAQNNSNINVYITSGGNAGIPIDTGVLNLLIFGS